MNEDQVIAEAFLKLREGILEGNWETVCAAYYDISGEELSPPEIKQPKTRLEKIREMMNLETLDDTESKETPTPKLASIDSMTVKELKDYLLGCGINKKDLNGKSKPQLLKLLPQASPAEPMVRAIQEDEIQGGNKFGLGKVKIITDGYDPIEAELNQKVAERRVKLPPSTRSSEIKDTSDKEDAEFRFYSKPKMAPPWR